MKRAAIAIDVGGVSARVGLVTAAGHLLAPSSFPTGLAIGGRALMRRLIRGSQAALRVALARRLSVAGAGVAMPAFVDERGRVTGASNLPKVNGTPVAALLERALDLPVRLENDVAAGACGEYYFGGRRASRRMLFLAVGTGIGAGMMVDGRLLRVARGCLGDPGHIIVDASGHSPCRCGGNGCLEAVASGWALVEAARRLGFRATPGEIFARARSGQRTFRALARRAATSIGIGLASLCVLFDPDAIVLGGGVAIDAGEPARRLVAKTIRAHAGPFFSRRARVSLAQAGRHAGLLGAAALVLFDPEFTGRPGLVVPVS